MSLFRKFEILHLIYWNCTKITYLSHFWSFSDCKSVNVGLLLLTLLNKHRVFKKQRERNKFVSTRFSCKIFDFFFRHIQAFNIFTIFLICVKCKLFYYCLLALSCFTLFCQFFCLFIWIRPQEPTTYTTTFWRQCCDVVLILFDIWCSVHL